MKIGSLVKVKNETIEVIACGLHESYITYEPASKIYSKLNGKFYKAQELDLDLNKKYGLCLKTYENVHIIYSGKNEFEKRKTLVEVLSGKKTYFFDKNDLIACVE